MQLYINLRDAEHCESQLLPCELSNRPCFSQLVSSRLTVDEVIAVICPSASCETLISTCLSLVTNLID